MKARFKRTISAPAKASAQEKAVIEHIQALTDDLSQVIERGLSYDSNLNSKFVTQRVTNNVPTRISAGIKAKGALLLLTGGTTVTGQKSKLLPNGDLEITLTYTGNSPSDFVFLIIGE